MSCHSLDSDFKDPQAEEGEQAIGKGQVDADECQGQANERQSRDVARTSCLRSSLPLPPLPSRCITSTTPVPEQESDRHTETSLAAHPFFPLPVPFPS